MAVAEEALDGGAVVLLPHVDATPTAHPVRRERRDDVRREGVVGAIERRRLGAGRRRRVADPAHLDEDRRPRRPPGAQVCVLGHAAARRAHATGQSGEAADEDRGGKVVEELEPKRSRAALAGEGGIHGLAEA